MWLGSAFYLCWYCHFWLCCEFLFFLCYLVFVGFLCLVGGCTKFGVGGGVFVWSVWFCCSVADGNYLSDGLGCCGLFFVRFAGLFFVFCLGYYFLRFGLGLLLVLLGYVFRL